eukprot:UN11583
MPRPIRREFSDNDLDFSSSSLSTDETTPRKSLNSVRSDESFMFNQTSRTRTRSKSTSFTKLKTNTDHSRASFSPEIDNGFRNHRSSVENMRDSLLEVPDEVTSTSSTPNFSEIGTEQDRIEEQKMRDVLSDT